MDGWIDVNKNGREWMGWEGKGREEETSRVTMTCELQWSPREGKQIQI